MKVHICAWFVIGFISTCLSLGYSLEDPCENYTEITSDTLQATVPQIGWYRFFNTTSGLLATSCPEEDECSSPNGVVWINDNTESLFTFTTEPQQMTESTTNSKETVYLSTTVTMVTVAVSILLL